MTRIINTRVSDKRSSVTQEIRVTDVIYIGDENLVMLIFFVIDESFSVSPIRVSGIVTWHLIH